MCSKLTIKTPGGVFIVNFEHILHLVYIVDFERVMLAGKR